jgi:YegS/Rv2252/BmrU family lipid kinase
MRVLIVYNPAAGQAGSLEQELDIAADTWRERGWQVDLQPTQRSGDGTRIAREAAEAGYDIVAAAGGDGTINEVVNGLANTQTALAALPLGTVNVWARELGLPLQPRAAAEALSDGVIRPIDLGRADDRYFLLMAGVGFDATITAQVQPEEKRRFGALAYVLRGFGLIGRMRGTKMRLVLDGRSISGRVLWVLVGNSQLYGGLMKITHQASIDDGLLDVCVIRGENLYSAPWHILSILLRRYDLDPEIDYYRARKVEVYTRRTLPVQVDGDSYGETPMRFEVAPGALRALMPPRVGDGLIQSEAQVPARPQRSALRVAEWLRRRIPGIVSQSKS